MDNRTYGQRAVGVTLNPEDPDVTIIKNFYAGTLDQLAYWRERAAEGKHEMMFDKAIKETEKAFSFALKAVTYK
jgi:hypothetical protein